MALTGRICIVTGATRGIGKGIALQLGTEGATVYVTGRTLKAKDGVAGSLEETAKEVEARGGICIPVQCDHSKDTDIEELFKTVEREQNGRLDLLVNNAYSAVNFFLDLGNTKKKFYEMSPDVWDTVNNVGLRNHYTCAVYAARLMVAQQQGLIVWISSVGGMRYLFTPAYGIGKVGCDRMAADCAHELRRSNVACVSLWPGAVQTENIMEGLNDGRMSSSSPQAEAAFRKGESTEYPGKAVVALLQDKNVMRHTGKILMTADLGELYGFNDINGKPALNFRSISHLLDLSGYSWSAWLLPRWLKIPKWVMHMGSNKF